MDESEYIKTRVEDQITWYSDKADWCHTMHKWNRAGQIIFAAMLPVIVAVNCLTACSWIVEYFPIISSAIGASISVSVSISALCKHHEHWVQYRTTAESLKHAKFLRLTKTTPYGGDDGYDLFVQHVERLISKENTHWNARQQSK